MDSRLPPDHAMPIEHKYHDLVSFRRALDERLRALELDLKRVAGDIPAQVAKRKALAQSLELGRRLLEMYEPVKHSPGWIRAGASVVSDPVPNLVTKQEGEEDILEFEHNRRSYSLRFRRCPEQQSPGLSAEGDVPHALLSFCNEQGMALFANSIVEEQDARGRYCKPLDIEVFIPGEWIKDFLELSEEIAALKREMEIRRKYDPAELERLRRHFGL
ncbi:MAG: hypothetical protein AB1411_04215 [Nitrospirota bacterium]